MGTVTRHVVDGVEAFATGPLSRLILTSTPEDLQGIVEAMRLVKNIPYATATDGMLQQVSLLYGVQDQWKYSSRQFPAGYNRRVVLTLPRDMTLAEMARRSSARTVVRFDQFDEQFTEHSLDQSMTLAKISAVIRDEFRGIDPFLSNFAGFGLKEIQKTQWARAWMRRYPGGNTVYKY